MPLYFAYGSNMDVEAMRTRAPGSRPLGLARLPRARFIIMQGGYASFVRVSAASVHGVLWELALSDVRLLDRYEDVASGLYRKIQQPVLRARGGAPRAHLCRRIDGARRAPCWIHGKRDRRRTAMAMPEAYIRELSELAPRAKSTEVLCGGARWLRAISQYARAQRTRAKVRPRFATSPFDR